jgi:DNA-binding MarR family transcriptional regulator
MSDSAGTPTRWLTECEQATWRSFLLAAHLVDEALDRQLQRDMGMPHAYYGILVALSEAPDRTLRMGELAAGLQYSRSRLAHAIRRMEDDGWVERRPCPSDGRGQLATLTDAGLAALVDAAPGHVAEVRRLVIDVLDDDDLDELRRITGLITAGVCPDGER